MEYPFRYRVAVEVARDQRLRRLIPTLGERAARQFIEDIVNQADSVVRKALGAADIDGDPGLTPLGKADRRAALASALRPAITALKDRQSAMEAQLEAEITAATAIAFRPLDDVSAREEREIRDVLRALPQAERDAALLEAVDLDDAKTEAAIFRAPRVGQIASAEAWERARRLRVERAETRNPRIVALREQLALVNDLLAGVDQTLDDLGLEHGDRPKPERV